MAQPTTRRLQASTTTRLDNSFYAMRMFVGGESRRSQVGFNLLHKIIEALESRFLTGDQSRCIGIIFELENKTIQRALPEAIWPTTKFVYVGNNARGDHVRVRYFEGAKIGQPSD